MPEGDLNETLGHLCACRDRCGGGRCRGYPLLHGHDTGRGGGRRDAWRTSVPAGASGHCGDRDGSCLQGCCADRPRGWSAVRRRSRRLAELQQDADFGAILRPQPDQYEECRKAQGAVHLRHQTIHELRDRANHGGGGPDRHDGIRYLLARPGDLLRELAHARGLPGLHSADEPGCGLSGRHAVSRDPGRAGAGL